MFGGMSQLVVLLCALHAPGCMEKTALKVKRFAPDGDLTCDMRVSKFKSLLTPLEMKRVVVYCDPVPEQRA